MGWKRRLTATMPRCWLGSKDRPDMILRQMPRLTLSMTAVHKSWRRLSWAGSAWAVTDMPASAGIGISIELVEPTSTQSAPFTDTRPVNWKEPPRGVRTTRTQYGAWIAPAKGTWMLWAPLAGRY